MPKRPVQLDRFHYSLGLEYLDWFFSGKKQSHGMASAFSGYSYTKRRLKSITQKIRKRALQVITTDEDLKESLVWHINSLEEQINQIHPKNNNDQEIIAKLFKIIGFLLGWEFEGEFIRTPIYHQTEGEKQRVLHRRANTRMVPGLWECYHRRQLILQLLKEGKTYPQIALVLNLTETSVKQIERATHIDEFYSERKAMSNTKS